MQKEIKNKILTGIRKNKDGISLRKLALNCGISRITARKYAKLLVDQKMIKMLDFGCIKLLKCI